MCKQFKKCLLILLYPIFLSYFQVWTYSEVYFSPDDHPADKLIQLINSTKHKLHAAVYMLTDKQISQALIDAKKRGVDVKIVVDRATMDFEYGKGRFLKDSDIEIYVYSPKNKNKSHGAHPPIMHHKFAIFDDKIWTGSFNWTKSANQRNQENVIITTNKKVYARFEKQFEILKNRTKRFCVSKNSHKDGYSLESLWENFKKIFILNVAQ